MQYLRKFMQKIDAAASIFSSKAMETVISNWDAGIWFNNAASKNIVKNNNAIDASIKITGAKMGCCTCVNGWINVASLPAAL
jgi:parallel beta-helix repeat protein